MRRYILAVSVTHLYFLVFYVGSGALRPWQTVTPVAGFDQFPNWGFMMLSAATAPLMVGTATWVVDRGLRHWSHPWATTAWELAFVILGAGALLALLNAAIRLDTSLSASVIGPVLSVVASSLVVLAVSASLIGTFLVTYLIRCPSVRRRLISALSAIMLVLAPTAFFSFAGTIYLLTSVFLNWASYEGAQSRPNTAIETAPAAGMPNNIVVLLFDGFSYNVGFNRGEPDARLPNLRSVASQSVVFHNASSLFPGRTSRNVPVMLTGRNYRGSKVGDPNIGDIGLLSDGSQVNLKRVRNLFDLAQESGYALTVQGLFIDYCGTYVESKGDCQFTPYWRLYLASPSLMGAVIDPYHVAAVKLLPREVQQWLRSILNVDFDEGRNFHLHTLSRHNSLLDTLSGATGVFAYAHYPLPHGTRVRYNASSRELSSGETLFQSVEVVDTFLGEVRDTLERSGAWDTTFLVVVSDHHDHDETEDPRVPLLLKLPGSETSYDHWGDWGHEQFLPMFEELFRRKTFDLETVQQTIDKLTPISRQVD